MDDLRWRLGARLPGHDYRIFRTAFVEGEHPRGGPGVRFSLIEAPDWVNVVAVTRERRIVLLRQYRPGIDAICLEIPGGMIDPGEDPVAAAARELAEETGYTGGTWEYVGKVAPNPAILNNYLHTIVARNVDLTQTPAPDSGEVLAVETRSFAEVQQALVDGRIDHALVVVAFAHLAFRICELTA